MLAQRGGLTSLRLTGQRDRTSELPAAAAGASEQNGRPGRLKVCKFLPSHPQRACWKGLPASARDNSGMRRSETLGAGPWPINARRA
jgi:hypothetical protein